MNKKTPPQPPQPAQSSLKDKKETQKLINEPPPTTTKLQKQNSIKKSSLSRTIVNKAAKDRQNKAIHLTYTLLTINVLFFLLVSPLVIVIIMPKDANIPKYVYNIVYLLAYANHSFNFIFYGLSSPPYRESIIKILGLKKDQSPLGATTTHRRSIAN
jgi:hypothetical protein